MWSDFWFQFLLSVVFSGVAFLYIWSFFQSVLNTSYFKFYILIEKRKWTRDAVFYPLNLDSLIDLKKRPWFITEADLVQLFVWVPGSCIALTLITLLWQTSHDLHPMWFVVHEWNCSISYVRHNNAVTLCAFAKCMKKKNKKLQCDSHISIPNSILLTENWLTALTQEA